GEYDILADLTGSTSREPMLDSQPTFTFPEPFVTVSELVVGCYGAPGESASAEWMIRTGSSWVGMPREEVECDGALRALRGNQGQRREVSAVKIELARDGEPRSIYAGVVGACGD